MTLRLFGDLKPAGALDEWSAPSQGGEPVGFPAIRPTRNGSPSVSFPATGNGVIVVAPAGTDWSSWVQLTAGEAAAYVLAHLNARCWHRQGRPLYIQLGAGADPASNIVGEWYDSNCGLTIDAAAHYGQQWETNGYTLPASTALSARVKAAITCIADYNQVGLAVIAMPLPLGFTPDWNEEAYRQGVTQVKRVPDIGSTISLTTGAADQWGDWVELIASASGHLLIQGIEVASSGANPPPHSDMRLRVGTGPTSDSVTAQEATHFPRATTNSGPVGYLRLPRPVEVLAGDRVWLSGMAGRAAQPITAAALLHYLNF
jgi:hypothetical protein